LEEEKMSATQIKKVRAWHEELLEFILANPRASLADASLYFNVSQSWISIVTNSDAFKELMAQRRETHFSRVSASVVERVTALADITIEKMTQRVENDPEISIGSLKDIGDLALKSLGFGAKPGSTVNVNNNQQNVFIDKETLERARNARASLNTQNALEDKREESERKL
jgi:hypothetical protein